jgi:UDP-3-O-[3-hydroxymyristoyl] glucosamine N-acyltransferase
MSSHWHSLETGGSMGSHARRVDAELDITSPKSAFFIPKAGLWLSDITDIAGLPPPVTDFEITDVGPLETARQDQLAYMDNPRYLAELVGTSAGVCLISSKFISKLPATTLGLVVKDPYGCYSKVLAKFYPQALRPASNFGLLNVSAMAAIHPSAYLAAGVIVDPGAVIGPHARIGANTTVGANAVIGPRVRIGEGCSIGPGVTITNTVIGDRAILHPGARIGQDGFGFAMSRKGHVKVAQIGSVIIEDDVEIGANTTIDRGANRDTVIGEGSKIDNLVQIAHNVVIGRHCVIAAQVGIAGSTTFGDFVALGGHSAIAGHLRIGAGVQIAAAAGVMHDVPAGERWGGSPARPMSEFFRQHKTLEALAARRPHLTKSTQ